VTDAVFEHEDPDRDEADLLGDACTFDPRSCRRRACRGRGSRRHSAVGRIEPRWSRRRRTPAHRPKPYGSTTTRAERAARPGRPSAHPRA